MPQKSNPSRETVPLKIHHILAIYRQINYMNWTKLIKMTYRTCKSSFLLPLVIKLILSRVLYVLSLIKSDFFCMCNFVHTLYSIWICVKKFAKPDRTNQVDIANEVYKFGLWSASDELSPFFASPSLVQRQHGLRILYTGDTDIGHGGPLGVRPWTK
jgi:hypothetical protein